MSVRDLLMAAAGILPAPSLRSSTKTATVSGTSHVYNAPGTIVSGDLLVAHIAISTAAATFALPGGWAWAEGKDNDSNQYVLTAIKIAGGSEPSTYTFTSTGSEVTSAILSSWKSARFGGTSDTIATSTGTTPVVNNGVHTPPQSVVLNFACSDSENRTFTTPTGFSVVDADSNATAPSWSLTYKEQTAAASTGTISATSSGNGNNCSSAIVLLPSLSDFTTPSLLDSSFTQNGGAGTSLVITKPAATATGKLLLAVLAGSGNPGGWSDTEGFTEVADGVASSAGLRVAWKVATGSEPASYTFTATNSNTYAGYVLLFDRAAYDQIGTVDTTTGGGNVQPGSVTPNFDYSLVLAIGAITVASVTFDYLDHLGFQLLVSDSGATAPGIYIWAKPAQANQVSSAGRNINPSGASGSVGGVYVVLKGA